MRTAFFGLVLGLAGAFGLPAAAQSPFSAAIHVGDRAVTYYEIEQRQRLLDLFGTRGDLPRLAREQLIDDRVREQEFARVGLSITEEGLQNALVDFAARADRTLPEFLAILAEAGVEEETFRDYVRINVSWRDYIRARFEDRAQVTESDIDQVLATQGTREASIEVLLSEIIIPAPPQRAAEARGIAAQITRVTSTGAFEAAAREYSALPSREQGGRLDWLPIDRYPAPLQPLILDLAPGEVSEPIEIPNGIALFQLRDVREVVSAPQTPDLLDYAIVGLPGGRSVEGLQQAALLRGRIETCEDLWPIAREELGENQFQRTETAPADIPSDIALELAKLDPGEVSTALTSPDGQTLVFLMLCQRRNAGAAAADRDSVRAQLRNQQLTSLADALLADLRANAAIRVE
ncbi:peptidylprolyl isomerase [Wenxinia marina]|nr:peptidylprolyl isomerase [Wenxinia marina]